MAKAKLIVLGSGASFSSFYRPFDFRFPSGYLLQHNKKNYLIDCSEGIRERLEKIKVDYYTIENVFISHFHPDHFILATLVQSIMVRSRLTHEIKTLNVYGPEEIKLRFIAIWDAMHHKGHFENKLPLFIKLNFIEYKDGENLLIDDIVLTPYKVVHGNMPAYALRFEIDKKIFTYSGDSGPCGGIEKASKNADYFICEANEKIGENNSGHLNPNQVGQISAKSNAKNLYLTHLTGVNSQDEIKEAVKSSGFKGKVTITYDFDVIEL